MRIKWILLFFVLCVMFIIAGCGTVSDHEVKNEVWCFFCLHRIPYLIFNVEHRLTSKCSTKKGLEYQ